MGNLQPPCIQRRYTNRVATAAGTLTVSDDHLRRADHGAHESCHARREKVQRGSGFLSPLGREYLVCAPQNHLDEMAEQISNVYNTILLCMSQNHKLLARPFL